MQNLSRRFIWLERILRKDDYQISAGRYTVGRCKGAKPFGIRLGYG